jgi:hypothetical protein
MSQKKFIRKSTRSLMVIVYPRLVTAPRCHIPMQCSRRRFDGAQSYLLVRHFILCYKAFTNRLIILKVYPMLMIRIKSLGDTLYQRARSCTKITSRPIMFHNEHSPHSFTSRMMLTDPKVWGDPDVFRPERFLEPGASQLPNPLLTLFGWGLRCVSTIS